MLYNYLVTTFRNWRAQKIFNFLNIGGLTLGIISFILISLFIQKELSYDQFFSKKDNIYRLNLKEEGSSERILGLTTIQTGDKLVEQLPEIKRMVRIEPFSAPIQQSGGILLDNKKLVFAESSFFQIFDFPLLKGDKNSVLNEPNTVVLSASLAQNLFGGKDPIGEILEIKGSAPFTLKVTGIVSDNDNSHISYDAFVSWETNLEGGGKIKEYFAYSVYTYFELAKENASELEEKINQVFIDNGIQEEENIAYLLQPLSEIYLNSNHIQFVGAFKAGSAKDLKILGVIGIILLVVSVVNYVNITTAKNSNRALEVGVRKFLGASKKQLIVQFVGETLISVLFATLFAILFTYLLLPFFSNYFEVRFTSADFWRVEMFMIIALLILGITLFSGLYPAIVTAGFTASGVLKNNNVSRSKGARLRKVLTTVHFSVSIVLVIGSMIVSEQYDFLKERPLGFNKEQVIVIDIDKSVNIIKNKDVVKDAVESLPGVLSSSIGTDDLGSGATNNSGVLYPVNGNAEGVITTIFGADHDFINTYEIELVEGRNFDKRLETDQDKVIVNETFLKEAGWENGLEKAVAYRQEGTPFEIIGVVKDFHFRSLHHQISPVLIRIAKRNFWNHAVRIESEQMESTLQQLENIWKEFEPIERFSYSFVDDEFMQFYKKEKVVSKLILLFTVLSILIALLGLFALSAHQAKQRYKEIGIRKTLGASILKVLSLFILDVAKLLMIAVLAAIPLANFVVAEWLQTFPYHLSINVWHFVIPILMVSAISLLTVLVHSLKAANIKIVETLRD